VELPFAVHPAARPDFERRWARARPLVLLGFLGPPAVSIVVAVVLGMWSVWSGALVFGVVVLTLGCLVPVWFVLARVFVRRSGWWGWLVGLFGLLQAIGVSFLSGRLISILPVVAVVACGVVLAIRGRAVLLDASGGAIAGTTLQVRSASRPVRSVSGRLLLAYASFDGERLRWEMSPGPSAPDILGGELALSDVIELWVAESIGVPAGPVVVVRTAQRQAQLVMGDPHGFAELLDQRLRLRAQPGWSH
jgi:hypothetical protein